MTEKIIVSGFGGQGVLMIGQIIGYAALEKGLDACFFPAYGPTMRGGTANCNVTLSDEEIGSPILVDCDVVMALNNPSIDKFESYLLPGGKMIINSSIADHDGVRSDVQKFSIPATEIAIRENNERGANMVMLGAYIAVVGSVDAETVYAYIDKKFSGKKAVYAEQNKKLVRCGIEYFS